MTSVRTLAAGLIDPLQVGHDDGARHVHRDVLMATFRTVDPLRPLLPPDTTPGFGAASAEQRLASVGHLARRAPM